MSLKGWLRGWVLPEQMPSEKDEKTVVTESLMMELDLQLQNKELEIQEQEEEKRKSTSGVDYSWLVNRPKTPKRYELPQMERLELEELCSRIRATECTMVISLFREGLLRKPDIQDISRIFRTIIRQVIDQRPKEETVAEKVIKNLNKVRPASRVTPLSFDDGYGMTPVTRLGEIPPKKSSSGSSTEVSSFDTNSENQQYYFSKSMDDLPV